MVIGSLGDVVFEVSSETVKSFDNYKRVNRALLSKNEKIANVSVENHKIILAC